MGKKKKFTMAGGGSEDKSSLKTIASTGMVTNFGKVLQIIAADSEDVSRAGDQSRLGPISW